MLLSEKLREHISEKIMLLHPFYQTWHAGSLTMPQLQEYATQYYHHVNAFPRYVSSIHSLCEDNKSRRLLFENLTDEEHGEDNHPALWLRFAAALQCPEKDVETAKTSEATKNLIDTFFKYTRISYATGLAALYTYEHQIPAVATTKIAGLKEFYGITTYSGIQYFDVHQDLDIAHAKALENMIDNLPEKEHEDVLQAAKSIANTLWKFLDQFLVVQDNTVTC